MMRTEKDRHEELDGRDTEWDHFLRDLDDLILDNNFRWARPTLIGIRETVERTSWVTLRQREAVRNIVQGLSSKFR